MPLDPSITDPITGDTVSTSVCVQGTYAGDDGGSINIQCQAQNTTLNDTQVVTASVDTTTESWEASFTLLPCDGGPATGTYSISVMAGGGPNQIFDITVSANPPISNNNGNDYRAFIARVSNPKLHACKGTYNPGYDYSNGYFVKSHLTLHGGSINDHGHLVSMSGGNWEYHLCVHPYWSGGGLPTLHSELWMINGWYKLVSSDIAVLNAALPPGVVAKLNPLLFKGYSLNDFDTKLQTVLTALEYTTYHTQIESQARKHSPVVRLAKSIVI